MTYDPDIHHRRSIRLADYDYALEGTYFVTVCTESHLCLLGEITDGTMRLNESGRIVYDAWRDLPNHYPHVELDAFVVMPNHVHMIVVLIPAGAGFKPAPINGPNTATTDIVGAGFEPAPIYGPCSTPSNVKRAGLKPAPTNLRHGLPEIVRAFKTFSSRRVNEHRATHGQPLWQRNYYEHVIRNDVDLNRIRQYIADNPARWAFDHNNPAATNPDPETPWAGGPSPPAHS
jgi:REP element-mobilizing transposase RayT